MQGCKKSPLFPHDLEKHKVAQAGFFGKYKIYIIAGMAALVCIIIIAIFIVVCLRCHCCGGAAEKKYPIGGGIYNAEKKKRAKQNLYEPSKKFFADDVLISMSFTNFRSSPNWRSRSPPQWHSGQPVVILLRVDTRTEPNAAGKLQDKYLSFIVCRRL